MPETELPFYLLPGMAPNYPVYSRLLPLLPNTRVVTYRTPARGDTLVSYARRMAKQFPSRSIIIGTSFGGVLAQEICRSIQPLACILISTIKHPSELPPQLKLCRIMGGENCVAMLQLLGTLASVFPRALSTNVTIAARGHLGDAASWRYWAMRAILDWRPTSTPIQSPLLHLHGSEDATFPVRYTQPCAVVPGGKHALPVSNPEETAHAILGFVNRIGIQDDSG